MPQVSHQTFCQCKYLVFLLSRLVFYHRYQAGTRRNNTFMNEPCVDIHTFMNELNGKYNTFMNKSQALLSTVGGGYWEILIHHVVGCARSRPTRHSYRRPRHGHEQLEVALGLGFVLDPPGRQGRQKERTISWHSFSWQRHFTTNPGSTPCPNIKPKRRSWIWVFSRKERKERKTYRDGGVL